MAYTLTEFRMPSLQFNLEDNTATATRVVRIEPWEGINEALADLSGGSLVAGNTLVVVNPARFPGRDNLWLYDIQVQGLREFLGESDICSTLNPEDSQSLPTDVDGAVFTLKYKTPKFDDDEEQRPDIPTDTFLTISRSQSVEYVAEDVEGLWYEDGVLLLGPPTETIRKVPITSSISSVIAIADIRMTWSNVRFPPRTAIRQLQGCVNYSAFLGYATEQVMFTGVQDQINYQSDGTSVWALTYQFNVRVPKWRETSISTTNPNVSLVEGGWNHFPVKGAAGTTVEPFWQRVFRVDTAGAEEEKDLLFPKGDFSALFQLEQ